MKFYFMIGLPTETMDDIDAIVELAMKAKREGDKDGRGRRQINVSVGTFVPKPHTPFQWEQQINIDESREKIRRIKAALPRTGINLKWHDPEQSFLEGVFSRGDRRLAKLLETAWQGGARLDGWSDHFNLNIWRAASEKCGLSLDTFLRRREPDEILPWQHLHSGIETAFLQDEMAKALTEAYTPDCRYHGCQQCGLCDFKVIRPIVHGRKAKDENEKTLAAPAEAATPPEVQTATATAAGHFKYNVTYSRTGDISFLGHLELLQLVFRALRRAGITTHFSQGFNPSPKISFGLALPVGTESLAEYFIMDLPMPLKSPEDTVTLLNQQLPPGVTVQSVALHSGKVPQNLQSSFTITCPRPLSPEELSRIDEFLGREQFPITRSRKGKNNTAFDIRPLVAAIIPETADTLRLELLYASGLPGVKPIEILTHVLQMDAETAATSRVLKTAWHTITETKEST
jgi:radical SAM-linked protein